MTYTQSQAAAACSVSEAMILQWYRGGLLSGSRDSETGELMLDRDGLIQTMRGMGVRVNPTSESVGDRAY